MILTSVEIVEMYLAKKQLAWANTTWKTETVKLRAIAPLINGKAEALYKYLSSDRKPYTVLGMFNRVIEIWDLVDRNENPYRKFKEDNARLFKNCYVRKDIGVTFEEAKERISRIPRVETREKAMDLLCTGMRWSESFTEKDGKIVGKGNKVRTVFRKHPPAQFTLSKETFYKDLKKQGLTPHMLRKLCATEVANKGGKEADLLKIFGWSNIATAGYYLQSKKDEALLDMMGSL
jgi:integrase